jgi:AcrR family transcriptional regulator
LYYYFPDKTALVLSVGERILGEFIDNQKLVLEQSDEFEKGIYKMLEVRMDFGQKYFMMHIGDIQSDINTSDPKFKVLMEDLKSKELKIISAHIQRFQDEDFIKPVNSVETAQVLIDMLAGLWICGVHVNHKSMLPSDQLFENIKTKCKRVISIFCDGIKK